MRRLSFLFLMAALALSCSLSKGKADKRELTPEAKKALISEINEMLKLDQQNRSFLDVGTLNPQLVDSVANLSDAGYYAFLSSHESELTSTQEDSLWAGQNALDLQNTNRLYAIVEQYGWLTMAQLDSMANAKVLLYHTPKETIAKMQALLLEEVKAGRMPAIDFAVYVDNMRKKAFGQNQLYGTGDEFDPKTRSVVPPFVDNIDSTNSARTRIGLPELREGEYRTEK